MKHSFFQAAIVLIQLYGCTTWMPTKQMEKKLDGNYTRILRAILSRSWRQQPTKQQLYGNLQPITKRGGERGSGISVLVARQDDNDDKYREENYVKRLLKFCCTATYLLSLKLSKLDELDMQDTAREVGTSS